MANQSFKKFDVIIIKAFHKVFGEIKKFFSSGFIFSTQNRFIFFCVHFLHLNWGILQNNFQC